MDLTGNAENELTDIEKLLNAIAGTKEVKIRVKGADTAAENIKKVTDKLAELIDKAITITVGSNTGEEGEVEAKGNVALAAGRTLMGELGPELVVANGKYFTVGNNGAEFVNLPNDAIVFNHLQTQRLLSTGSTGRGRPVVNESAAVSFARGNAMASASEIVAQLKTLRAMWQNLAESSITNLIGTANSGGGSGNDAKAAAAWTKEVERWYNLLQKIARLEKEINIAEAKRNELQSRRLTDGKELYKLSAQELTNYKEQAAAYKQLYEEQQDRFKTRREDLAASPLSTFYTFEPNGQMKFDTEGFAKLQALVYQTDEGTTLSPQEQLKQLLSYLSDDPAVQAKLEAKYMSTDMSGLALERGEMTDDEFAAKKVEVFMAKLDAEQLELQNLYDGYMENEQKYYEALNNMNEILNAILDNQKELENKVVEAIENREQAIIDNMTKEREALSKSSESYING